VVCGGGFVPASTTERKRERERASEREGGGEGERGLISSNHVSPVRYITIYATSASPPHELSLSISLSLSLSLCNLPTNSLLLSLTYVNDS